MIDTRQTKGQTLFNRSHIEVATLICHMLMNEKRDDGQSSMWLRAETRGELTEQIRLARHVTLNDVSNNDLLSNITL